MFSKIFGFALVVVLLSIIASSPAEACECYYGSGGCRLGRPAKPGNACRCEFFGAGGCRGIQTTCRDGNSHHCKRPDLSIQSCHLGGGDCGGY